MSHDQERHVSRAQLHTYARGEVDPARKAVIEAHLAVCPTCRDRLRRVEGVTRLLSDMGSADLDDLRWRRIREVVRSQLEQDAQQPTTADVMSGRRWVVPALAAASVVAMMVWGAVASRQTAMEARPKALRSVPSTEAAASNDPAIDAPSSPDEQLLASGAAPLTVTLASGARLELEPRTRVRATAHRTRVQLSLAEGALRVRVPRPTEAFERPTLETPAFKLQADSEDFYTGFWSDKYFIDVRNGSVTVSGDDFSEATVIKAGERREGPARFVEASPARSRPKTLSKKRRPKKIAKKSDTGTVTVDVEPPADPVVVLWRQANEAYYRQRDLREAVRLAERVVELGGPHAQPARQLLCDAQISLGDGKAALTACRRLLDSARSEEDRRNIHFTLGTIYRALRGDCSGAIKHFNQALVFGRQHILDDEVRISRAQCALDVGDIALAERDVGSLSARAGRLARPEEVTLLQRRLAAAKKSVNAKTVTTD